MPHLLVIAHAPLASALRQVAEHTFPDCAPTLAVLDVHPGMCAEDVETAARRLMAESVHPDWLVMTDAFGATPSNGALRLAGEPMVLPGGGDEAGLFEAAQGGIDGAAREPGGAGDVEAVAEPAGDGLEDRGGGVRECRWRH